MIQLFTQYFLFIPDVRIIRGPPEYARARQCVAYRPIACSGF